VLSVYLVVLIARIILSWITAYARSWSPTGILLVVAEGVYSATDPPLRFLRRYIPSVRLGSVALDLSFMLLFLVVYVLWQVAR
jgi:YggT family protein